MLSDSAHAATSHGAEAMNERHRKGKPWKDTLGSRSVEYMLTFEMNQALTGGDGNRASGTTDIESDAGVHEEEFTYATELQIGRCFHTLGQAQDVEDLRLTRGEQNRNAIRKAFTPPPVVCESTLLLVLLVNR